jgi:phytoene dehydrogenase-like protein
VVIGAGHNGLVAALRLAAAGWDVTVVEAAEEPGGAVRSGDGPLPGHVYDHCAGFFPFTLASPAFAGLGVRERVDWIAPPVAMAHPFADGAAIVLHRDLAETAASLDAAAPGAGRAWREFAEPLLRRRHTLLRAALGPFPPVRAGARLAAALRRDALTLARQMVASSATLGLELFGDERAAAWLSGTVTHGDITPGSAGGAAFAVGLAVLGHAVGWPYPRGGSGRLTDALVERLGELGGEVRCGAPAEAIEARGGRARGVRLRDGERLAADAVVSTLTPRVLAGLLGPDALPERLLGRLRGWRPGLGTFKLDLALAGPVPWASAAAREAGVVHLGDTLGALFAAQQQAGAGRVPDAPALVIGQHSLHDATRAPAGRHTLYAYAHVPQRPDLPAAAIAERMEQRIEAFAPGFSRLILGRRTRMPAELEAENACLVGGDIVGGSLELDQQLVFRPAPELFRGRTPLPGLYVAGAGVHPGGGVHGASGHNAARAVLADAKLRRGARSRGHPRRGRPSG